MSKSIIEKLGGHQSPWSWKVNESQKSISLHSHAKGGYKVMDFVRYGTQSAQPRFCEPDGIMYTAKELSVEIIGQEHNVSWNKTLTNVNAKIIAAAPEMLEALIDIFTLHDNQYSGEIDYADTMYQKIESLKRKGLIGKNWEELKEIISCT